MCGSWQVCVGHAQDSHNWSLRFTLLGKKKNNFIDDAVGATEKFMAAQLMQVASYYILSQ